MFDNVPKLIVKCNISGSLTLEYDTYGMRKDEKDATRLLLSET